MKVRIIQDSKEKQPLQFDFYDGCSGQVVRGLKTGDYTAEGYEDLIIIERKCSTGELCQNLGKKFTQFKAEFERMQDIPHRYLVCEFPREFLYTFPENSTIPKRKWKDLRINPKFMRKRLYELCEQYGVQPIFCSSRAEAEETIFRIIYNTVENVVKQKEENNNE